MIATSGNSQQEAGFTLQAADVGPLFIDQCGFSWNALSPFAELLTEHSTAPAATKRNTGDAAPQLSLQVAAILARPDACVMHRHGGPGTPPVAFSACLSHAGGAAVVLAAGPDDYLIQPFESVARYLAWWVAIVAGQIDNATPNDLSPSVPLPTLLYVLHAVDACRRAKYREALRDVRSGRLCISTGEFTASMAEAIVSHDLRWLLPTFLVLTPGVQPLLAKPRPEHLRALIERNFLLPGQDQDSGEPVFYFGQAGERMGAEFSEGWKLGAGVEVTVLTEKGALPHYRAFLASTLLANHIIEVEPDANGNGIATHHAMTDRQLLTRLGGVLSEALEAGASVRAVHWAKLHVVSETEKSEPSKRASTPSRPKTTSPRAHGKPRGEKPGIARLVQTRKELEAEPAAAPRGPKVTVRQWFRSLHRAGSGLTSTQVEEIPWIAASLRRLRDESRIPEETFRTLHGALRLKGADDTVWTVGLKSLKWNRFVNGRWEPADPPDAAFLDARALQTLAAMRPQSAAPSRSAAVTKPRDRSESSFVLTQQQLRLLLDRVHYAMGHQDRPNLNGVQMTVDSNELKLVATDGHRLALATCAVDRFDTSRREVMLPRSTIAELLQSLSDKDGPVEIELLPNSARFWFEGGVLESEFLSGAFPDYQLIIPRGSTSVLRVDWASVVQALQRVASRSSTNSPAVRLEMSTRRLTIHWGDDQKSAQEELKFEYRGTPLCIGFNVQYLLDALNGLGCDQVEIAFSGENAPALVTIPGRDDFKCVVMPRLMK
jgi:DNA polymerase III beta subunit, C-terminal domain/DNA polymerase III beta subunit, central domain